MYLRIVSIKTLFPVILLLLTLVTLRDAHAQMFSVQDEETGGAAATPNTGIYLGIEPVDFTYEGGASFDPDAGVYEFDGPVIRVKLEAPGIYAYIGIGGGITGIEDHSWFDAGVMTGWKFRVLNLSRVQLVVPVQLKSSITAVRSDLSFDNGVRFEQGTLEGGGGGEIRFRATDRIRIVGGAITQFGFSFATGGTFGGNIYELATTTRIYFDQVFGNSGISVGWDYQFKRFNVDDNLFDYNLRSNSFLIGITF